MAKHHIKKDQLRIGGWTEEEILEAEAVLDRAEAKKHPLVAILDGLVFWFLLLVVILGIVVFAVVIIPLIAVLDTWALYAVLCLMGISLGTLFTIVIQDIHWLGGFITWLRCYYFLFR